MDALTTFFMEKKVRVNFDDRWLYYDDTTGYWVVKHREYRAKKSQVLYQGELDRAVLVLREGLARATRAETWPEVL